MERCYRPVAAGGGGGGGDRVPTARGRVLHDALRADVRAFVCYINLNEYKNPE